MWFVYVVRCRDGTLYTGIAKDLERRLEEHASGRGAKYTRGRGPLRLRYWETHRTKGRALRREAAIKRMTRSEKLRLRC